MSTGLTSRELRAVRTEYRKTIKRVGELARRSCPTLAAETIRTAEKLAQIADELAQRAGGRPMTGSLRDLLAGVLSEHWQARMAASGKAHEWECVCDAPLALADEAHIAHVVAEVAKAMDGWLDSEDMWETVYRVISEGRDAHPRLPDDADSGELADAALAAIREQIGGVA